HGFGSLHRHCRCNLRAAVRLYSGNVGLQSDDLVPRRHHGASRWHKAAVGSACRRDPFHDPDGFCHCQVPKPYFNRHGYRVPGDRLFHPEWCDWRDRAGTGAVEGAVRSGCQAADRGAAMSGPALSVRAARKTFGGLVAVNDVSFEVKQGELLGLIGPNGSGKTTMLNLISGALKPSGGEIVLDGQPIAGLAAHHIARKGVARTFQLVRILPSLDAEQNVMAGAVFGHQRSWGEEA